MANNDSKSMPNPDDDDDADLMRFVAAKWLANDQDLSEQGRQVREVFRAGGIERDKFLDSFAEKIEDIFWSQMRQCGGDIYEPPLGRPEDWHLLAVAVVLAQIRKVIALAELGPFDEESLMGITQVTLDSITGKEVNQLNRKWLGLELRDEPTTPEGAPADGQ